MHQTPRIGANPARLMLRAGMARTWSMIPKSGNRFSEKIMLHQKPRTG
jgi:hypothetical protein